MCACVAVKSYVVIDEVHERSVENDLLLATLRQMLIFASRKRSSAEAKILQVCVRRQHTRLAAKGLHVCKFTFSRALPF